MWLYCSEIPPLEYRHIGGSITAFGEWLGTFLFVLIIPIGLENIGWRFWIFVLVADMLCALFVYFVCPETGGKTLEDIDYIFSKPGTFYHHNKRVEECKHNVGTEIQIGHEEKKIDSQQNETVR